ncbi:MAG TPA: hypothetical protein VLZ31_05065 [Microbacteriaceae bacterium]|nr:hypothetical protein [Microbacteriaceae bacterium]
MNSVHLANSQKFSVQNFAPVWGAAVMGTGVISVLFAAATRAEIAPVITKPLALIFLVIAALIGTFVLSVTTIRWVRYPKEVMQDLSHPVKGGMSATFAGAWLVLAVAVNRVLSGILPESLVFTLTIALTVIGGVLAVFIGVVFLGGIFARGDVQPGMITGVWFIPPVVTIIVPTALAPLLQTAGKWQNEVLWISWIFFGMGTMLYMVVVATLFYRSATNPLPPAHLAPSLLIGMGPAGLIGLDLVLLSEASVKTGLASDSMIDIATTTGTIFWAFGLWWGLTTLVVLKKGYDKLPFALSWWGFTFPLGAWSVAGLVIGSSSASIIITALSLIASLILIILWGFIIFKTAKGIRNGTVWAA